MRQKIVSIHRNKVYESCQSVETLEESSDILYLIYDSRHEKILKPTESNVEVYLADQIFSFFLEFKPSYILLHSDPWKPIPNKELKDRLAALVKKISGGKFVMFA